MVRKNNFASVIPPDVNKIHDESYQLWSDGFSVHDGRKARKPI